LKKYFASYSGKNKQRKMSRAFYIPPQTQINNNSSFSGGNSELVDILIATLISLLQRRHQCTRRCCARIAYHHVSIF
jgi:hypothetical protein